VYHDVVTLLFSYLASFGLGDSERRPLLEKPAAAKVSAYLHHSAQEKGVYMKLNFVNPDHVPALIDLPTSKSIEEIMQLFKGSSSNWINEQNLYPGKFAGAGAMVSSPCRTRVSRKCRSISPIRKSVIGRKVTWGN
jgi:REP element-mobilizing transposase RayT